MHEVLVNRLGGLSLPRKSVVRLTDRPDLTLDVYRGPKTTTQQQRLYNADVFIVTIETACCPSVSASKCNDRHLMFYFWVKIISTPASATTL